MPPARLGQSGHCRFSVQLRVLHLGVLQDGDVGAGVFPSASRTWTSPKTRLSRRSQCTQKYKEAKIGGVQGGGSLAPWRAV
jgi:hypothetical protein